MADSLSEHLKEEQIYRFDHYLGKIGVQQISAFRNANPQLEKVLNSEHVASIKVCYIFLLKHAEREAQCNWILFCLIV